MKHFFKTTLPKIYLSLSLSLCFLVSGIAQGSQFITEINLAGANLTLLESTRWQHFGNMGSTQSIRLVEIGAVPFSALTGGSFTFSIPGISANLQARGGFVQQTPNGDYVWWANLSNDRGYFGIASNASGKVAYAQVDGQHYMLYLLSDRYNALVKLNSNPSFLPQQCLPELASPSNITFDDSCEQDSDCSAIVSVLVLVTPEALDWLGGNYAPLEGLLYFGLGLHTVNFAFLNSGIYHKSVRFIVESYDFDFGPNDEALDDLQTLENDPVANSLRNATRADLMFLITDSRYFPLLGGVLTGASAPPYLGFVSMEYLSGPWFTFAHELGHTFLLNHNRISNDGDFPYEGEECPFGWRFHTVAGAARTTIMAVIRPEDHNPGAVHLLNYSNPNIFFEGLATGTPTDFNARQASHSLCIVDDYFFDDELRVNINGPIFICEETVTYTAEIIPPGVGVPGVGPYNIQWGVSAVEFPTTANPMFPLGSANPLTLNSGSLPVPVFWLYVSVISADGVSMNDILRVDNPCGGTPLPLIGDISSIAEKETLLSDTQAFELSPNPVSQNLHVRFLEQPKNTQVEYSIFNSYGELVLNGAAAIAAQVEVDISLRMLPDGLYYLHLSTDTFSGVQKFVIHH